MIADSKITKTIILELDMNEAQWLAAVMQNQLNPVNGKEETRDMIMREALFTCLHREITSS